MQRAKKKLKRVYDSFAVGVKRFLYILLCFMLVYLFFKSVIPEESNVVVVYEDTPINDLSVASADEASFEEDLEFIEETLGDDESGDVIAKDIADLIEREIETLPDVDIATVVVQSSKVYELYEEDLPDDIHEGEGAFLDKELGAKIDEELAGVSVVETEQEPEVSDDEDVAEEIKSENGRHIRDFVVKTGKKPPYFASPVIAVVIDDMGISLKKTREISSLEIPLTSSFLTYGTSLDKQVKQAVEAGHEIMVHVPMEAKTKADVAPDVLTVKMNKDEIEKNLRDMLAKFKNVRGINNHMGSLFTEDRKRMGYVMEVLKEKDLFFLDSKTSPDSKGFDAAKEKDVDYVGRNVFLDNKNDLDYILGQLKQAERIALKNGYAVAIGHPKSQTFVALKKWAETLDEKGIKLVHLSNIVDVLNK